MTTTPNMQEPATGNLYCCMDDWCAGPVLFPLRHVSCCAPSVAHQGEALVFYEVVVHLAQVEVGVLLKHQLLAAKRQTHEAHLRTHQHNQQPQPAPSVLCCARLLQPPCASMSSSWHPCCLQDASALRTKPQLSCHCMPAKLYADCPGAGILQASSSTQACCTAHLMLLQLCHVYLLKEGGQLSICQDLVIEHVHYLFEADAVAARKRARAAFCRGSAPRQTPPNDVSTVMARRAC